MKTFIKWFIYSTIMVAAFCHHSLQAKEYQKELEGKWRGELVLQEGVSITLGININNGQLTLDSPNQGMFDHQPTKFSVKDNKVEFTDTSLSASYQGQLNNGQLEGLFVQGKKRSITLHKLTQDDKARLTYEATYKGDLPVSENSNLPLQVNIAVVHEGYIATLDSPAQQSFGIPLTDVHIDDKKLSFKSPMIQASFNGKKTTEGYEGTFKQGQEFPLTFKKAGSDDKQASAPTPELGEHGAAVAIIDQDEIKTQFYGRHDHNTQYEIGSVTKTMVAYLLAHAVVNESTTLDTPVNEFWPQAPDAVTLGQLATHHSGLPRLPENLLSKADQTDPYVHYGQSELESALAEVEPGVNSYEYSNFGYGLLAESLARNAEKPFPELLNDVVFETFSMPDTYVATSKEHTPGSLATGHNVLGDVVPHWHFQSLAGAGAIVSTLSDMTNYTKTLMRKSAEGDTTVEQLLAPQKAIEGCCQQALAWLISEDEDGKAYAWHNGQTAGFSSFVGFYLDGSRAAVMLNAQSIPVNDEAIKLLTQNTGNNK
ncbi:UNVERIFIED_ORG: CubicO group peptidase (beta-lactamase class C family) [Idiomarina abyssalis]|uniref:serine hydrolase domain-containing protein n=1 Tax=unclassified Idiomarina TaxID=2614829 RepID=UPI000E0FD8D9|nr:serine hydrolase domain-containing protein [Idiomarina sp. 017G]TDO45130.1 CubicO group peptidase (beta-lactamase class C family) [Idiomarina sp. 017G]